MGVSPPAWQDSTHSLVTSGGGTHARPAGETPALRTALRARQSLLVFHSSFSTFHAPPSLTMVIVPWETWLSSFPDVRRVALLPSMAPPVTLTPFGCMAWRSGNIFLKSGSEDASFARAAATPPRKAFMS